MSMRSVLAGIGQKDYRDEIQKLMNEGWSAKKSNGGHIRMTHPDADTPVFAASTPSCKRSVYNLRRYVKASLQGSAATYVDAPTMKSTDMTEDVSNTAPRPRRKGRWSKKKIEMRNDGRLPVRDKADSLPKAAKTPAEDAVVEPVKAKGKAAKVIKSDKTSPAPVPVPEPSVSAPAAEIAHDVRTVASSFIAGDFFTCPEEHLVMALKIRRGEAARIDITPDMVGGALFVSGDHLVMMPESVDSSSASDLEPASRNDEDILTETPDVSNVRKRSRRSPGRAKNKWEQVIFDGLGTDWKTLKAILEKGANGAELSRSNYESARYAARRMVERGEIEESTSMSGRKMLVMFRDICAE